LLPKEEPRGASTSTLLMHDDDTDGWIATGGSTWKREDGELSSGGARGHLLSERRDFADVRVHARCRVASGSRSALWLRAEPLADGMSGIAIALNADHPDPARTASVRATAREDGHELGAWPRTVGLVGAGTWFDLDVSVVDEPDGVGTLVTVDVNGVTVRTARVTGLHGRAGGIAIEQGHEGSLVQFGAIETRVLERH